VHLPPISEDAIHFVLEFHKNPIPFVLEFQQIRFTFFRAFRTATVIDFSRWHSIPRFWKSSVANARSSLMRGLRVESAKRFSSRPSEMRS
jgi:hypothetical protein